MISQTAEYALRAVVFMAENPATGHTVEQVAQSTRISTAYLSKVLQQLGRARIVKSRRGIGGGFILNAKPAKLTVLDVLNAVDPVERIYECPLGLDIHKHQLCPLHRRLDEAAALVERAFGSTTIAQLLSNAQKENIYTFPFPTAGKDNQKKKAALRKQK